MGGGASKIPQQAEAAAAAGRALNAAGFAQVLAHNPALAQHVQNARTLHAVFVDPSYRGGGEVASILGASEEDSGVIGAEIVKEFKARRREASDQSKRELVEKLAAALNDKSLGFSIDTSASLESVAAQIVEKLPDPHKGRSFSADAEDQKMICKAIAGALNKQFPQTGSKAKLIDVTASPQDICRAVCDLMFGLSTGVCVEFLEIYSALEITMRNAVVALELAKNFQGEGVNRLREAVPEGEAREAEPYLEAVPRFMAELDRLLKQLEGLLHVTMAPAKAELEAAHVDLAGRAKEMLKDFQLGTSEFGTVSALTLSGLGSTAKVAVDARRALAEVGVGLDEFKAAAAQMDWGVLDAAIDAKRIALKDDPKFDEKIGKFERAAVELRRAFGREGLADAMAAQATGGDEEKKTPLEKKEERRRTERKLILKQYLLRSQRAYEKFLAAVKIVGPRLGREIPVTEKLEGLREALARLDRDHTPKLDLSLIGLYTTASARSARSVYLNHLKHVRDEIDVVMAEEAYSAHSGIFRPIQEAIDSLVQTIEFYSLATKKFRGADEPADDEPEDGELAEGDAAPAPLNVDFDFDDSVESDKADIEAAEAAADGPEVTGEGEVTGGVEFNAEDLQQAQQLRTSLDLRSAVNNFLYYFFIAKVQENLKATVPELERYGDKYTQVLGDAVAGRIHDIDEEYKKVMNEENPTDGSNIGKKPVAGEPRRLGVGAANWVAADIPEAVEDWEATKTALKEEHATKKDFYRLLQAVDLYMKGFAQGIAADPEAVTDIKASLNGVNVLAKWFTESTGDDLASFFEATQRYQPANNAVAQFMPGDINRDGGREHYYQDVAQTPAQVGTGGAFRSNSAKDVKAHVGKALNNFQALKNLLNAFARLGSRLDGKSLEKQSFMGSAEMYRIMIKFLRVSSISTRIHADDPDAANANNALFALRGGTNQQQAADATDGMRACYVTPIVPVGPLRSNWTLEHKFFQYIIKAIAAKVLVVVGVFDLLERPEPLTELTPTRMILGGYPDTVEVIPEATELYFRLPRLAEFYKSLFSFDAVAPGGGGPAVRPDEKIAMLPELEGVFGPLIAEIFVRSSTAANNGTYSEMECDGLIGAINKIYDHYRSHGAKATQKAIEDFIKEINRRYGVIKKADYEAVMTRQQDQYTRVTDYPQEATNYAILPDEETGYLDDGIKRLAPADRYAMPADRASRTAEYRPGQFDIGDPADADSMWAFLRDFRRNLTQQLTANFQPNEISYRSLLRRARKEIDGEKEPKKRAEQVYRLIQGSELLSGSDQSRSLMFHETVVLGLNTLTAIHDILDAFRTRVARMDVVRAEEVIMATWANAANAVGLGGNGDAHREMLRAALEAADVGVAAGAHNAPVYLRDDTGVAADDQLKLARDLTPTPRANDKVPSEIFQWARNNCHNNAAIAAAAPRNRAATMRDIIDRPRVMRDLILNIFELTGDLGDLVTVRFPGSAASRVHLDFSKLRDLAESTMEDVRQFMNVFRPVMAEGVIRRFEADGRGSLQWLEEHLVDGMLRGTRQAGGAPVNDANTLEGISRKVNGIMMNLTKEHDFRLHVSDQAMPVAAGPGVANVQLFTRVDGAADEPQLAADDPTRFDQYGLVFSRLLFWDATQDESGFAPAGDPGDLLRGLLVKSAEGEANVPSSDKTIGYPVGQTTRLVNAAPDAAARAVARRTNAAGSMIPSWTPGDLTDHRSLVVMFNQLLGNYVSQFYDPASGKIYQGLIDSFANGSFSQSVMENGFSQPDFVQGAAGFGRRGDPTSRSVLFSSVALLFRRLVKEQTSQGISRFLVASLAEIPLYIKENYRASLPVYEKLFAQLGKQAEFLKSLLQRLNLNCGRGDFADLTELGNNDVVGRAAVLSYGAGPVAIAGAGATAANAAEMNQWLVSGFRAGVTIQPIGDANANLSAVLQPRFVSIIDAVSSGCYTLTQATQGVVRELADEPLYFQTSESSIQEFAARNQGKMPLMPLSLAMFTLRDVDGGGNGGAVGMVTDQGMMPWHGSGSQPFKFLYGTRGLLGTKQQASLASMPGVKQLISDYNGGASRDKVDEARYAGFAQKVAVVLRFLVDTRSYRSALVAAERTFGAANLFESPPAAVGGAWVVQDDNRLVYPLRANRDLAQVLEVTDTTFREVKLRDIVAELPSLDAGQALGARAGNARQAERVRSIIDMNIPPINVHALMRTMALANLYNYGYTFEEMAARYYQTDRDAVAALDLNVPQDYGGANNSPRSTRGFFLKLLQDPFAQISPGQYGLDPSIMRATASYFGRLCRGDNDLAMGRPKFISDQLYNKVLFGSLYPVVGDFDESGPSGAISRGRDDWGDYEAQDNLWGFATRMVSLPVYLGDTVQGRELRAMREGRQLGELANMLILARNELRTIAGTPAADPSPLLSGIPLAGAADATAALAALVAAPNPAAVALMGQWQGPQGLQARAITLRDGFSDAHGNGLQQVLSNTLLLPVAGTNHVAFAALWGAAVGDGANPVGGAGANPSQRIAALAAIGDIVAQIDPAAAGGGHIASLQAMAAAPPAGGNLRYDPRFILHLLGVDPAVEGLPDDPIAPAAQPRAVVAYRQAIVRAVYAAIDADPEIIAFRDRMNTFVRALYALMPARRARPAGLQPDPARRSAQPADTDNVLTFIRAGTPAQPHEKVQPVAVGPIKGALLAVGKDRFDTALIRSLFFIVNVWRLTRAKLSYELAQQRTIIERGEALVASEMTEFGTDPRLGVNELAEDRRYFSERRI